MKNKNKQYLEKLYKIGKSMGDIREYVERIQYGDKEQYSNNEYIDAEKYEFEFLELHTQPKSDVHLEILTEEELDKLINTK